MNRYIVRKMKEPKPRHNVSGDYGVWDRNHDRWVLNTEFLSHAKAQKMARLMNK